MDEMHMLGYIVKSGAAEMEVMCITNKTFLTSSCFSQEYLKVNYCPTLDEEFRPRCEQNLADNYVAMLQMVVNHFFVDGAGHICTAWGVCQPRDVAALIGNKQPRP